MKTVLALSLVTVASYCAFAADQKPIPNRMIDYNGFLQNASAVQQLRDQHRISEQEFIQMAGETGTIIFDARSDSKFAMLHVKECPAPFASRRDRSGTRNDHPR